MHLYTECKAMVLEALEQCDNDFDEARDFLHESCDGHDTFGNIACRIAFATLLCECEQILYEMENDNE